MSLALRGVAQRVDAHADEMDGLRDRRVGLMDWRRHLAGAIADLRRRIAEATEDEAAELQAEADALRRQVEHFGSDVISLVLRRQHRGTGDGTRLHPGAHASTRSRRRTAASPTRPTRRWPAKPPAGASPEVVYAWWQGLTARQRQAIIAAAPGAIGNLDGIPAAARDEANRVSLGPRPRPAGRLRGQRLDQRRRARPARNARAAQDALDRIEGGVDPVTGDPIAGAGLPLRPRRLRRRRCGRHLRGRPRHRRQRRRRRAGLRHRRRQRGLPGRPGGPPLRGRPSLDTSASNATMFWIGYDAPDNLPSDGRRRGRVSRRGHGRGRRRPARRHARRAARDP